jgi:glycine/D-amino acid oxidase-like deaminating enzyme
LPDDVSKDDRKKPALEARAAVAIFGGGIAGLWLLAQLRSAGMQAVLFESNQLAAGQTRAAQGIIHGGVKYDLEGAGGAAGTVRAMPARWREALAGRGGVDLSGVNVLAPHCHFWTPRGVVGALSGFLGATVVRAHAVKLAADQWPAALGKHPRISGKRPNAGAVYRLDEPVIEIASLARTLAQRHRHAIFKIDWPDGTKFERDRLGNIAAVVFARSDDVRLRLLAGAFVFLCGQGNEAVLRRLEQPRIEAQRRPLHMLMMRGAPTPLFAHCFKLSDKPRLTITSHQASDGELIWYIGGQLAESGVDCEEAELIARGRTELADVLPDLDLSRARFAGFRIDRAEAAAESSRRPDGPVLAREGNVMVAWPTKLALAPALADAIAEQLSGQGKNAGFVTDQPASLDALDGWPQPTIAPPPWEGVAKWH